MSDDRAEALRLAVAYVAKVDAGNWLDWEKNSFLDYQLARALIAACAELDRMRPVYEAACRWRGRWGDTTMSIDNEDRALRDAVDQGKP